MKVSCLCFLFLELAFYNLVVGTETQEGSNTRVIGGVALTGDKLTQTPFPQWLTDFTGMNQWPGLDPPYIPLSFIDMAKIPDHRAYRQGHCLRVSRAACSFDCHVCLRPDDVGTCGKLSQTFDDGPSRASLKLIDSLENRSTFFVLGINTVNHPEVYRELIKHDHLIGSHSWSHKFLPSLSNEEIIAQIEWSIWAMNATGGHYPKWFRPPYGGIDDRVRAITRQFGLQAVLWDHDSFDWSLISNRPIKSEEEIYSDVRDWKKAGTGLLLEHDGVERTVDVGINVNRIIGKDQLTVAECVGGIDYIRTFPID
ncbi:chitin deacetylase 2 [Monosporozyma unispora]|nr:chitin deacetylase cda1 [Kazachstania unispora]